MKKGYKNLGIRIDDDLYKKIVRSAEYEERSISSFARIAVQREIARIDRNIRLKKIRDKTKEEKE